MNTFQLTGVLFFTKAIVTKYNELYAITVGELAKVKPVKTAYEEMIMDMDFVDVPRDSRLVKNKKYNNAKERGNGKTFPLTFADEVQQIYSMVATDDFTECVTITHECVPSFILYTSRRISDQSSMCFDRKCGSILSFDKTYNLSRLYLTVGVYRNLAGHQHATHRFF